MKSVPAWTPAIVRKHPALLVEWLRVTNSLSRWSGEGSRAVVIGLSAAALLVALAALLSGHVVAAIRTLAEYRVMLSVVAAIYAATSVSGRKRQLEEAKSQSWLIATPIPPRSLLLSQAIRALLPLFVLTVIVVMFPVLVAVANEGIASAARTVAAAAGGGLLIGGVVGWWTSHRAASSVVVPSRYVPKPRVRRSTVAPSGSLATHGLQPDFSALAGWPIAQVFSWSRPENSRYVLVAALLAVQGGSSAVAGLSVVAMYFVASYLAALLSATMTVAKSAAVWLRATPITLMSFVWSVSRRALIHQLIGTALAMVCMLLLGAPLALAVQLVALWLGLFISVSGCALIDNYRGRSAVMKIAVSIATVAALAAVVQLRAGAKT